MLILHSFMIDDLILTKIYVCYNGQNKLKLEMHGKA